jgi:hypothetical protein
MVAEIPDNTVIPEGATEFLVYLIDISYQIDGKVSLVIEDRGIPLSNSPTLTFTDTHSGVDILDGDVLITKAADESTVKFLIQKCLAHYPKVPGTLS